MEHPQVLLFAFLIGVVGGLRALTAPAVTSWAAHVGWLNLADSPLKFMASMITVVFFTILALVELVTDQLPSTPARTKPAGLCGRGARFACMITALRCRSRHPVHRHVQVQSR